MFRVDIGIKYRSDGYQDKHFKTDLDKYVQSARPVRIDDTYDPETKTWGYYIPLPMGPAVMESGTIPDRCSILAEAHLPLSGCMDQSFTQGNNRCRLEFWAS